MKALQDPELEVLPDGGSVDIMVVAEGIYLHV
jgi:hypothetical protein